MTNETTPHLPEQTHIEVPRELDFRVNSQNITGKIILKLYEPLVNDYRMLVMAIETGANTLQNASSLSPSEKAPDTRALNEAAKISDKMHRQIMQKLEETRERLLQLEDPLLKQVAQDLGLGDTAEQVAGDNIQQQARELTVEEIQIVQELGGTLNVVGIREKIQNLNSRSVALAALNESAAAAMAATSQFAPAEKQSPSIPAVSSQFEQQSRSGGG